MLCDIIAKIVTNIFRIIDDKIGHDVIFAHIGCYRLGMAAVCMLSHYDMNFGSMNCQVALCVAGYQVYYNVNNIFLILSSQCILLYNDYTIPFRPIAFVIY